MTRHPTIRAARPDDHPRITAVCDAWWGRPVQHILPRLFLDHCHSTSLIAEDDGRLAGFVVGFPSQDRAGLAYIHVAGVAPAHRRSGLARARYERFFAGARDRGRTAVRAVTSPGNTGSIAFHRAMGFGVTGPNAEYDGAGGDRVVFERAL